MIKVILVVMHSFYQSGTTVTPTIIFDSMVDCQSARTALLTKYDGGGSFFSGYQHELRSEDVDCISFKVDKS